MVRVACSVRPACSVRAGFTLVEAVVALTLLAVGLLGAAATQSLAARLLREAEARAGAVVLAGSVLDSLLSVPAPVGGEREEARYRVRWTAEDRDPLTTIVLEVEYHDGSAPRRLRFEMLHAVAPPRIGGGG
jgi:prepilin-type N-terminal cleavage/methylation domain-containing protein